MERGEFFGGQFSSGTIVWGQLSWAQFSMGEIILGGNCPERQLSMGQLSGGQFFSGAIVPEAESTLSADLFNKAQATHPFKFRCAHKVVKKEGFHMV